MRETFGFFANGFDGNVIPFGRDRSLSAHTDNKKRYFNTQ